MHMTNQDPNEPNMDIFPRDQTEHYKIELARLRSENDHLSGEVDYLRRALAAALSKIPQLEATNSPTDSDHSKLSETTPDSVTAQAESQSLASKMSWQPYMRYFPLASVLASPFIFLLLLVLGLSCASVLVMSYLAWAPSP
jgi:hypothetical protein